MSVPILFELVKEIVEIVYGAAKVGLIAFEHSAGSFVGFKLQGSVGDGPGTLLCMESVDLASRNLADVLLPGGRGTLHHA